MEQSCIFKNLQCVDAKTLGKKTFPGVVLHIGDKLTLHKTVSEKNQKYKNQE